MTPPTELRRDSGCCDDLNWRFDLDPDQDPDAVERRWVDAGFRPRARLAALRVLRHDAGHEVAWVIESGRVQLRVPITVTAERREATARRIHRELLSCLETIP
jgi:hypothetical protein